MLVLGLHTSLVLVSLLRLVVAAENDNTQIDSCAKLVHLRLENTTILSAGHVSGPVNVSTPGSCQSQALVSSSLCRVQFVINTTSTSAVHAEAWLPDTWFGRFLGLGNGGLGGCVDYVNLDYGTSLHFAAVGSDNGHDGDSGSVFLNHPEVLNDFAFRAIHVEAVIGKQIVEAYYGRPHHKSYYLSCSTGGRQGTQEALKFPEDFDGIVAGSPATNFNSLLGWATIISRFVGAPDPTGNPYFIPADLWNTIASEVLKQCDGLDGVEDGIITEPDDCQFRPEAIVCAAGQTTGCLTSAQIDALHEIYQPLFGTNGELLASRYDPGTEADGNAQAFFSGSIHPIADDWFRFAVLNDSSFNFENFDLNTIELGDRINPGDIQTFNGDLSTFKARGGKFLTYHGRRDEVLLVIYSIKECHLRVNFSAHSLREFQAIVQLDITNALHAFPR
ncbi:putative feruloyl esterase B [Termitomyces sp. J132]|nr:putative feruloyl esterase B [Termitomyces sp. J132]